MKIIDNILYIEYQELLECGVSENTIKKAKNRSSNSWHFIDDPADNRKVLIGYEKLGTSYKEKLKARYGDPYSYVAKEPIKKLVEWDATAEKYYLAYRYDGDKMLSIDHVNKYTKAASWLNMLKMVTEDKKALKKLLNLSIDQFYVQVIELLELEKVDLPTSYRRLLAKRKEYEEKSYESLIDWRFGNKLAAKVKDELAESVLLEMIAHGNQFDDVFVAMQYNKWATENGYKAIDPATVGVHRRKNEPAIMMQRSGNSALNEKYIRQVKGFKPTYPLAMVESDDNHLDLFFIDPDDSTSSKYFHKYKAIVVMDAYNNYVLGYAYAENLSIELVKAAYINAMYYIRSLTGSWYLPHETKSDKWAIKTLKPFYEGIGNYIETPVGSKHRGYIEQFFGSAHWKRCIKAGANNYSGNNITAKTRGVNTDVLRANKSDYPLIGDEAAQQIESFFHRLRHMPDSKGVSKHEQWMTAWTNMSEDKKRLITDEQFLLKFGIEHNYNGEGYRITNRGVEPQINNIRYSYDLVTYDPALIGKSVSIFYDPYDMSRVLLTDFDKVRVLATDARLHSRALADADVDSRKYLNAVLGDKVDMVTKLTEKQERRKEVIQSYNVDAESILQSGIMDKEIRQSVEQVFIEEQITRRGGDVYDKL